MSDEAKRIKFLTEAVRSLESTRNNLQEDLDDAHETIAGLRKELAELQESYHLLNEAVARFRRENGK